MLLEKTQMGRLQVRTERRSRQFFLGKANRVLILDASFPNRKLSIHLPSF